jgi:hypothetical protein
MGAIRYGYSARCKFFADDHTGDNRINWYFVPDDTPRYTGWSVFHPKVDERPKHRNFLYEIEGPTNHIRTRTDGFDSWGKSRLHVDGDSDDFLGLALSSKYAIDGAPPTDPCPGIETMRFMWKLGFKVPLTHPIERISLGIAPGFATDEDVELIQLGIASGVAITTPKELIGIGLGVGFTVPGTELIGVGIGVGFTVAAMEVIGIGLGVGFTVPATEVIGVGLGVGFTVPATEVIGVGLGVGFTVPATEVIGVGLAVGCTVTDAGEVPDVELLRVGMAIGCTISGEVPDVELLRVGLAIGCTISGEVPDVELLRVGLAIGCTISGEVPDVELLRVGLAIGCTISGEVPELLRVGLAIGCTVADEIELIEIGVAMGITVTDPPPPPPPSDWTMEAGTIDTHTPSATFTPASPSHGTVSGSGIYNSGAWYGAVAFLDAGTIHNTKSITFTYASGDTGGDVKGGPMVGVRWNDAGETGIAAFAYFDGGGLSLRIFEFFGGGWASGGHSNQTTIALTLGHSYTLKLADTGTVATATLVDDGGTKTASITTSNGASNTEIAYGWLAEDGDANNWAFNSTISAVP